MMSRALLKLWLGCCALWAAPALAQVYTDPQKADADFAVQGEYAGEVHTSAGPQAFGFQVVAEGQGGFRIVGFLGGLPGAGGDKSKSFVTSGKTEKELTTFKSDQYRGQIQNGTLTLLDPEGKTLGTLRRVERASPTLGLQPPDGALVLFNGKGVDHFPGGKQSPEGWLEQGTTSSDRVQSCQLHIEFLLPYQPTARGQGRGNSGVYLQGRYEVQMLDSFGLEGKDNECGGLYSIAAPKVNMCLPPLTWQTYDIDFTAAKYDDAGQKLVPAIITVRHNGVVIHENVALPKSTTAAPLKEGPEPGPIYLQNHGNPVRYRNIWVVKKD